MAGQRQAVRVRQGWPFKGRQFSTELILWAVRWYLMFPISHRDLELMLIDRGVLVDHTTIFRWIQAYAAELEKRIRPHLRMSNGSWRVDETYVKGKGRWIYLYRAVDSRGQTIDFLLSAKRDAEAATPHQGLGPTIRGVTGWRRFTPAVAAEPCCDHGDHR
jgi:transposase-like protein